MELKLHEIYKQEYCISPIPSLAMHATNINSTMVCHQILIGKKYGMKMRCRMLKINTKAPNLN